MDLVNILIKHGANDWNKAMEGAVLSNNMNMINFFIKKGANDWTSGMSHAAYDNNKFLIDFFMKKNINIQKYDWNSAICIAQMNGFMELADYIRNKQKELE